MDEPSLTVPVPDYVLPAGRAFLAAMDRDWDAYSAIALSDLPNALWGMTEMCMLLARALYGDDARVEVAGWVSMLESFGVPEVPTDG